MNKKILLILIPILAIIGLSSCVYEPLETDLETQNIYPITNNLYDIGSPLLQYQDGYFMNLYLNGVPITSSQWATDVNGINYSSGSVGINTPSIASSLVNIYSNNGSKSKPVLIVSDNTATDGSTVLYVSTIGAKSDDTYGVNIDNYATSGTAGADKYGIKISSGSVWNGVGSVNYAIYIADPVGGATRYALFTEGGTVHLSDLPVHADNAAAILGGLIVGDLYRTGGDPDVVCVVH